MVEVVLKLPGGARRRVLKVLKEEVVGKMPPLDEAEIGLMEWSSLYELYTSLSGDIEVLRVSVRRLCRP